MKHVIAILMFAGLLPSLQAQTNLPVRSLSLQDCITEALRHNFDVQVARYSPEISAYNLSGAYGGYDPLFNVSGQHAYSVTPSSLTQNQFQYPSSQANVDSFNSGLSGVLPWGFQYDLSANVSPKHRQFLQPDRDQYLPEPVPVCQRFDWHHHGPTVAQEFLDRQYPAPNHGGAE